MPAPTPFKPALLIVDLQEDFCPPSGALPVPCGRDIIAPINTLLTLPFALKIATKDWHPASHISFATNHPSSPPPFVSTTTIVHPTNAAHSYTSTLWPVHCVQQSAGAEFAAGFDVDKVNTTVYKGMDERVEMYSAFCDPFQWVEGCNAVAVSELSGLLKEKGVTDVYVAGLAMDYCVLATARDAVKFGFRTWVVREGTRAVGGEEGARTAEKEMREAGVTVVAMDGGEVAWVRELKE
ncbi:Isochorismatase-like protein [Tricharina praecox]|uniref:Isochorismatase-like protein n=1 Tax=Tricharina praecox TaxID=43433 RepID=UPI00221EAD07|nr:Isochorismatase-like protein [Tricharina praecox]KAI5847540.1 Isochorismatase-like protein [Tricharina praecox]